MGAQGLPPMPNSTEDDAWFRARVQEALDDVRPDVPDAVVKARFAERRDELLRREASGDRG